MHINELKEIYWGKEEADADELTRKDVIYRGFLGDRQIWEKTKYSKNYDSTSLSDTIVTTWHIVRDFHLDSLNIETNITGDIDWGDYDITEDWRSGLKYDHHYAFEGDYNISFICNKHRNGATIGRIRENPRAYAGYSGPRNELIGVSFGKIPYLDHMIGTNHPMFYGVKSITKVTIPDGLASIQANMFYGTNVRELIFPKSESKDGNGEIKKLTIGAGAFVVDAEENRKDILNGIRKKIYISSSVSSIGAGALGCDIAGNVLPNVDFYYVEGSAGATYVNSLTLPMGSTKQTWDEKTIDA